MSAAYLKTVLKSMGVNIDPKMNESVKNFEEPKTIILDLSGKKKVDNSILFPQVMAKDYDFSESKTFSPSRTIIKGF